jgi:FMN-dependent NADH-azoreductase
MKSLLVINASGRVTRSITRQLTSRFADAWTARFPDSEVVQRDVGTHAPPALNEAIIAAAFTPEEKRTPAMKDTLALSDKMVDELFRADAIVLGAPMYNFGAPAQLKAYIDSIVRVGRTFAFGGSEENPYQALIPSKPLVIITATGGGGYEPGGAVSHMNFLEPHLKTVFEFIGLSDITFVRVGFEEVKGELYAQSVSAAETALDEIVDRFAAADTAPIGEEQLAALP